MNKVHLSESQRAYIMPLPLSKARIKSSILYIQHLQGSTQKLHSTWKHLYIQLRLKRALPKKLLQETWTVVPKGLLKQNQAHSLAFLP